MFGKKNVEYPIVDIYNKTASTKDGIKNVPATKAKRKKYKKDLKRHQLDWIDRIEEFDAFMG